MSEELVSLEPEVPLAEDSDPLSEAVAEAEAEATSDETLDAILEALASASLARLEALLSWLPTLVLRVLIMALPSEVKVVKAAEISEATLEADAEAEAAAPPAIVVSPVVVTTSPLLLVRVSVKVETTSEPDLSSLPPAPRMAVEMGVVRVEPPEVMVLKTVEMVASMVLVSMAADLVADLESVAISTPACLQICRP